MVATVFCGPLFAQDDVVEVPFEIVGGHIVLSVGLNGHGPYRMILDTGASVSIIDMSRATAENLHLGRKTIVAAPLVGNGRFSGLWTKIPRVTLGAFSETNVDAVAVEFSEMVSNADGILGYSFLKNHIVRIDYQRHLLRLYPRTISDNHAAGLDASRSAVVPFRLKYGGILFDIKINGQNAVASIDTGAPVALMFTRQVVSRLGLPEPVMVVNVISSNGNQRVVQPTIQTKVREIDIGTIALESPPVEVLSRQLPATLTWDVNIGSDFLKGYVITIDYVRKKLLLERNS